MRGLMILLLCALATAAIAADSNDLAAVVHKASVVVHAKPDFKAPALLTLKRDAAVKVAGQDGLWYRLALENGVEGYVRVNEIRVAHTGVSEADTLRVLLTGKSGQGRVTETAGVRGLEPSDLKSAQFNAEQLVLMQGNRVDAATAAAWAAQHGLVSTTIAWTDEPVPLAEPPSPVANTDTSDKPEPKPKKKRGGFMRGLLGGLGGGVAGSLFDVATSATPTSEEELAKAELEMGPLIAGRVLGARSLLADADAQHRVNLIGMWLASNSGRPYLPWTFAVIDSPEVNAFAAPGGYVMVTSGLYQLAANDAELAAVLAHEINHVVRRDHYEVVRKQELTAALKNLVSSQIKGGSGLAESLARNYVEKHGATMLMTKLDRDAEFRADELAQVYLARAGMNPLVLYGMLQKMSAIGSARNGLVALYDTHPTMDARLDRIDTRGYGGLEPYLERELTTPDDREPIPLTSIAPEAPG